MSNAHAYREIQSAIINWFHHNQRRDLPWRQSSPVLASATAAAAAAASSSSPSSWTPDPYHVWVSEVMSQQTQMDTVVRYFESWIRLFPTIKVLAISSEESVRAAWAGMGYYRRALFLKRGAEYVAQHFAGKLPQTAAQLREVPGIGPYTAAAIASICYGERVISVDGNVVRVMSRLRCERNFDPKIGKNIKTVMLWGQELMDKEPCINPGSLNQGLMELGARVCKPSGRPLCEMCPLQPFCASYDARERGDILTIEGVIPLKAVATKKRKDKVLCVVHEFPTTMTTSATSSGAVTDSMSGMRRFIVLQRPENGLLGGMLEFPSVTWSSLPDIKGSKDDDDSALLEKAFQCLRVGHISTHSVGDVRHIFSHIDMEVQVRHALWEKGGVKEEEVVCDALATSLDIPPSRISVKTEEEIQNSAASRLLLKVLQTLPKSATVKSSTRKRVRRL